MEVIILSSPESASSKAAEIFRGSIKKKPSIVLGLATGSTPLLLYKKLVQMHVSDGLSFSKVTTFNLDEYVGISADHEASYSSFMKENFFKHLDINLDNTYIPKGSVNDVPQFCLDYEKLIAGAGGIDVQLLGLGSDGHIGFNEPTSSLVSRTRIKTLTPQTREDNARFFNNRIQDVPCHVITMGVGTIMEAKHIVLLAFGAGKAKAVRDTIEGPVTSFVPASILQMHRKVTVIIDEEAAGSLLKKDYYRWVYENRPSWQKEIG